MSEELLQTQPFFVGRYRYYKLGATTLRQLKQEGVVKAAVPGDQLSKKPDGLIVLPGGTTKAVIEYKPANKLRTKKQIQAAIDQERAPAAALCKLLIVTSGTKSIWVNALNGGRVQLEDGSDLTHVVDAKAIARREFDASKLERLIDAADASLSESVNTLLPPSVLDPSALAATIWQKIWVQTGKSPEKCLYNVVELFVFKFLSDLGVLDAHNGFWSVVDLVSRADAKAALKHYANTCRKDVQELFPPGGDGTTIINGTIFVNEGGEPNLAQSLLFAEIVKNLADYDHEVGSFRYIKREFKTRLYESFLRQSAGVKALGQYFTPRNVVQAMVRMARPLNRGARICDPFCGVGGFLLELLMEDDRLLREYVSQGQVKPQVTLVGYDKGTDEQEDERTIILAKANMLIYFSDLLADYHTPDDLKAFAKNGMNAVFRLLRSNLGTFDRTTDEPYDLILTNPPYVTKGSKSLKDAIAQRERTMQFYDLGLKGTEGLALNWILKSLRTGGEAFLIVPDSLLRRASALDALQKHSFIRGVVSLPTRTFYSTPRRTYILAIEKKAHGAAQVDPVFAFIVGETGETRDTLRLKIEENHLAEMVPLFQQFRAAPDSFPHTDSRRCRIVPFVEVARRDDWRVDRWWSHEERVELGLDERRPVVDHLDFVAEVERHAADLQELVQLYRAEDRQRDGPKFQKVSLSDPAFSYITKNTGWTKTHLHGLMSRGEGDGTVPIYTAAASPVGFAEPTHGKLIPASVRSPAVSFAANGDGSAGTNFVLHDRPFYVTRDRTVLRIVDPRIDPRFLIYALRKMKAEHGFDHTHKAVPKNLDAVSLEVPVAESGEWDLEEQRRVATQHASIMELRRLLNDKAEAATQYDVEIQRAPE